MPKKDKSPWLMRLDVLQSISLERVAAELNERHLRDLRANANGKPVMRLPDGRRADGARMRQGLIALHQLIGSHRSFVVRMDLIAAKMGDRVSLATAKRSMRDLREASLILVTSRDRARRVGGQGPSEYLIVWPTVIDIAAQQGLQLSLFNADAETGESGRPDESSGRHQPSLAIDSHATSEGSGAPGQHDLAPGQHDLAPSRPARARSPFLLSLSSLPLLPGEEEKVLWENEVGPALARIRLREVRSTIRDAIQAGWTASQALTLIEQFERSAINGVPAWSAGAIWYQLVKCAPGTRIEMQPSEAYRRAKRDQDRARERQRQAESRQPPGKTDQLEAEYGPLLDQASAEELEALAGQAGPYLLRHFRSQGMTKSVRDGLLMQLLKNRSLPGRTLKGQ